MIRTIAFLLPVILTLLWIGYLMYLFPLFGIPCVIGGLMYLKDRPKYRWISRLGLSVDQTYNVFWSPWYNWVLDPKKHLFGHPDETVSSVIGKNLKEDDREHWRYIEYLLVLALEAGEGDHSIPAIEDDEGYTK